MAVGPMTDQEFAAWLQQHGGEDSRKDNTVAVKKTNPDPNAEVRETTEFQVHTTVKAKDGATITLHRTAPFTNAGGAEGPVLTGPTYEIIDQDTATTKPTGAAATPNKTADDEAQAAQDKKEKEANNALEDDPAYETNAVRRARLRQKALDDAAAAKAKTEAERSAAAEAERQRIATEAAKSKPPDTQPNPADPTRQQRWDPAANDGKGGWVDNGPLVKPATIGTVGHDDGGDYTITLGPDGKPVKTYATEEGGEQTTNPAYVGSMPTYIPKEIADDLTNYSAELNKAVNDKAITKARATALMDARIKAAQAAVTAEIDKAKTVYQGEITQRTQDATATQGRLNESGENYRQALITASGVNDWVNPGSDAGYRLFKALLEEGRNQAQLYGGLDQQPSVVPGAALKPTGITVQSPDGTVVTIPSTPQPPDPGMTPEQLQQSVQRPDVISPDQPPAVASSGNPQMAQMLEMGQPTGVASVDAAGQRMREQSQRPRMTFDRMEEKFRTLGMDEDAIKESRSHWMGAA